MFSNILPHLGSPSASIIALQRFDWGSGGRTQSQIVGVDFVSTKEKIVN
jgi:hypothetical protein